MLQALQGLSTSAIHFVFLFLSAAPAQALIIREFDLGPQGGLYRPELPSYARRQDLQPSFVSSRFLTPTPTSAVTESRTSLANSQLFTNFPSSTSLSSFSSRPTILFSRPTSGSRSRSVDSGVGFLPSFISFPQSSSSSHPVPFITSEAVPTSDSGSSGSPPSQAIPAIIGGVIGCLSVTFVVVCVLLCRRARRRKDIERGKIIKPFGSSEAGFHLLVDTDREPPAINPFLAGGKLQSTTPTNRKLKPPMLSLSPYSPTPNLTSPSSALSQQSLIQQLNTLRAQIQLVEALARNGSSTDDHEPPPEYYASLGNDTSQVVVRREKER